MQSTPIPTSPPTLGSGGLVGPPTFADAVGEPLNPPRPPTKQRVWVRMVAGLVASGLSTAVLAMSAILSLVGASAESSNMSWSDVVVLSLVFAAFGSVATVPAFFFSTDAMRTPLDRILRAGGAYLAFALTASASISGTVFLRRWAGGTLAMRSDGTLGDLLDWSTFLLIPVVAATFVALWVTEVVSKSHRAID